MLDRGREARFPTDMFEGKLVQVTETEYNEHLGSSHFNGGRFGKSSEPVSKDVLKLFASVLRDVSAKVVEVDCSDKASLRGNKTSQRRPCDACGGMRARREDLRGR